MNQNAQPSESGVKVDNVLTMALQRKSPVRSRFQLVLLALLGAVSSIVTLLSMFSPPCNVPVILLCTIALMLFFCWHAERTTSIHPTMAVFLGAFAVTALLQRNCAAVGMLHLLNAAYRTIYMTDWDFFEVESELSPELCTTFLICVAAVPVLWLLSYAVMRYQNFFLSLLVTFPFAEIGFFFGIAPEHLPAFGLFAFWCGMGAVQLAGYGSYRKTGKGGFLRRHNIFFPVTDMRFLLPEFAGVLTALAVLGMALVCEGTLNAMHYERPMRVKQMRSDFQHYAASIDLNDLSTLVPDFLPKLPGTEAEDEVDLTSNDKREFENTAVSRILFTEKPQSRIYLKYATYDIYGNSTWSRLPDSAFREPVFDTFRKLDYYPPEFLCSTAVPLGGHLLGMTLENPDPTLQQCIPYGFAKDSRILCTNDRIAQTQTLDYTFSGGMDYEYLVLLGRYMDTDVGTLEDYCPPVHASALTPLTEDRRDETLCIPEDLLVLNDVATLPRTGVEAAVLGACGYGDFVREHYLTLPETAEMAAIREPYADLLDSFDAQTATPPEKIVELQLLRERLCDEVEYSLAPGKTPDNADFVSYFLLDNKKGYCTHYATAAVLLSRMAGIPARYCEGYMIDGMYTEENGAYVTEILDSNAHAWCEVYIDGIGWIPFEFTYSYFTPPVFIREKPTEPPAPTEPATDHGQAQTPTERQTEPVHQQSGTDESPTELVEEPEGTNGAVWVILLVLLTIGMILLGFAAARQIALRVRIRALRSKKGAAAAWQWLMKLLKECGADTDVTTAADLMSEVHTACIGLFSLEQLDAALDVGKRLRYSPHALTVEDRKLLIRTCRELAKKLYDTASPVRKFYLKWIRHYL
ncbi:MAG: hypothetical protein K5695_18005 [Oscillospiraceae bacterium]|nr:hypothetical protein [Oscillospiraceae bacterium]